MKWQLQRFEYCSDRYIQGCELNKYFTFSAVSFRFYGRFVVVLLAYADKISLCRIMGTPESQRFPVNC